jgi:hypothetical protein
MSEPGWPAGPVSIVSYALRSSALRPSEQPIGVTSRVHVEPDQVTATVDAIDRGGVGPLGIGYDLESESGRPHEPCMVALLPVPFT